MLQIPPRKIATEYVEFPTGVSVLAIFSANVQENYISHSAKPGNNRSAVLEFRVSDAGKEGIHETANHRYNLGQGSHHSAVGNSLDLFSRSRRQSRQLLHPPRHGPLTYQPGEHCFRTLPPPGEELSLLCRDNGLRLAGGSIRAAQKLRLNPQELYLTFHAHPPK